MTITELLLAAIDEAYDKASWHGTNLRGSLRGVTPEQAAWRPSFAKASTFAKAPVDKTVGRPARMAQER
jgi:hypothetical protein